MNNKLASGDRAEIWALPGNRVIKILQSGIPLELIEREAHNLEILYRAGAPVPRPHNIGYRRGTPGLIMDRVEGPTLYSLLARRTWQLKKIAITLADVQLKIHGFKNLALLSQSNFFCERFSHSPKLPKHIRTFLCDLCESLLKDDTVCHFDLTLKNIIISEKGPIVVDWCDAHSGCAGVDIARSLYLLREASFPSVSFVLSPLESFVRRKLCHYFLQRYLISSDSKYLSFEFFRPLIIGSELCSETKDDASVLIRELSSMVKSTNNE